MSSEFEAKLRAALGNSLPSSSNLSAFALDVEYYLEQTGMFSQIRLKKTGEPERALLVTCTISDPAASQSSMVEILKQIWVQAPLGYGGEYDVYDIQQSPDTVQMDFVTVASYGVSVTGSIIVTGFKL